MNYKSQIKCNLLAILIFSLVIFSFSFNFSFAGTLQGDAPCKDSSECASNECVSLADGKKVCKDVTTFSDQSSRSVSFKSLTSTKTFQDFICNITAFLSQSIVPPVAVLMTLVVGFLYLASQGDPKKITSANTILLFTVLGITVVLLSPGIVSLVSSIFGGSLSSASCGASATTSIITEAIVNLVNWMAWFITVISVAVGLYAAFLYLTAVGNAEQFAKANKVLIFAIIGIVISILAFSIISIVNIFI